MIRRCIAAAIVSCSFAHSASAEVDKIVIARQPGNFSVALAVMEKHKLIEKHATKLGVPKLTVSWPQMTGGTALNEALLSGSVNIAATGVAASALLWDKTGGKVKGLAGWVSYRLHYNTRNPNLKSLADLSDNDRIALPSIIISTPALEFQMEVARLLGFENWGKFNSLMVPMTHADSVAALLDASSAITVHATSSPFHDREIADPRIRTIYDVLATNIVVAREDFVSKNPLITQASFDALNEANRMIYEETDKAIAAYIEITGEPEKPEVLRKQILDKNNIIYTVEVSGVEKYLSFMHKAGIIKKRPETWRQMFFPIAHHLNIQ